MAGKAFHDSTGGSAPTAPLPRLPLFLRVPHIVGSSDLKSDRVYTPDVESVRVSAHHSDPVEATVRGTKRKAAALTVEKVALGCALWNSLWNAARGERSRNAD